MSTPAIINHLHTLHLCSYKPPGSNGSTQHDRLVCNQIWGFFYLNEPLWHWPGSAGCYPPTAVTMRVVVVGERVVSVLAGGLVGGQGLRAGCIDGASHEHPSESRPQCPLPSVLKKPVILFLRAACPDASQLLCAKAIGSAHWYLNPTLPLNLSSSRHRSLCLHGPPPSHRQAESTQGNQISHFHSTKSSPA